MPSTTESSVTTADPASTDQDDYDAVLALVGVSVADAPKAAVVLGDAKFCGWDQQGPIADRRTDLAGRKCFVQSHLDGRSALFLIETLTNEGDPISFIYRTDGGHVTEFGDWTRDNLGAKEWRQGPCPTLYVASYDSESPPRLAFLCYPLQ